MDNSSWSLAPVDADFVVGFLPKDVLLNHVFSKLSFTSLSLVRLASQWMLDHAWDSLKEIKVNSSHHYQKRKALLGAKCLPSVSSLEICLKRIAPRFTPLIGKCPALTHLMLSLDPDFIGYLAKVLPASVRKLHLMMNHISPSSDAVIAVLSRVPKLVEFTLAESECCQDTGSVIYRHIAENMPDLKVLGLRGTDWSVLKEHPSLEKLFVHASDVTADYLDLAHLDATIRLQRDRNPRKVGLNLSVWDTIGSVDCYMTLLLKAAASGDEKAIRRLILDEKVNVNARTCSDDEDLTSGLDPPLISAVRQFRVTAGARWLIELGADVTMVSEHTKSTVFYSVMVDNSSETTDWPFLEWLFGEVFDKAAKVTSPKHLLIDHSDNTLITLGIVRSVLSRYVEARLAWLMDPARAGRLQLSLDDRGGKDDCPILHYACMPKDIDACFNIGANLATLDKVGRDAMACLLFRCQKYAVGRLALDIPDDAFAAMMTPPILSCLPSGSRGDYLDLDKALEKVVKLLPESKWAELIFPTIHIRLKTSYSTPNGLTDLVRNTQSKEAQLVRQALSTNVDISRWKASFSKSDWNLAYFDLPLFHVAVGKGRLGTVNMIYDIASKMLTKPALKDFLLQKDLDGLDVIQYAEKRIASLKETGEGTSDCEACLARCQKIIQGLE